MLKKVKKDYEKIFDKVMERYEDARSVQTLSCAAFYNRLQQEGTTSPNPGRAVKPCLSDFICDVELAAKSVLDKAQLHLFIDIHVNQNDYTTLMETDKTFRRMNNNIVRVVAREFVRRRIHPMSIYFKAREVHG